MISERNYPGLLYAQVLRSPYPRARIVRLDVSKAERLPGVRAILTYAPINLHVPKGVRVRYIDPVVVLQSMTYHLKDAVRSRE